MLMFLFLSKHVSKEMKYLTKKKGSNDINKNSLKYTNERK